MLLATFGAIILENLLSNQGVIWAGDKVIRAGNAMKRRKDF